MKPRACHTTYFRFTQLIPLHSPGHGLNASFAAWQVGEICVKIEVASCCILCSIKELSTKRKRMEIDKRGTCCVFASVILMKLVWTLHNVPKGVKFG